MTKQKAKIVVRCATGGTATFKTLAEAHEWINEYKFRDDDCFTIERVTVLEVIKPKRG